MRQLPTDPASPRERRPSGLTERMASASPGASRSTTARVASGVTSVGENPVPPVVTTSPGEPGRQLNESGRDRGHPIGHNAPIDDAKPVLDEDAGQLVTGLVLTRAQRWPILKR